jgi:hypothetical protein
MGLKVTMQYIDSQGEVAAEITADYKKMDYADVVKTQSAVVNALIDLGHAGAELKAQRTSANA